MTPDEILALWQLARVDNAGATARDLILSFADDDCRASGHRPAITTTRPEHEAQCKAAVEAALEVKP